MADLTYYSNQSDQLKEISEALFLVRRNANHNTRWYGILSPQTATEWADPTTLTPYQCISGNGTWGAEENDEAKVFGTDDLLWNVNFGSGSFDEIYFVANSSATIYRFRLIYGTAAQSMAQAIAAEQWSETMFIREVADKSRISRIMPTCRIGICCQIWAQCMNATDNATLDFFVGVHGYEYGTPYHSTPV